MNRPPALALPTGLRRRHLLGLALAVAGAGLARAATALPPVEVWKDPNCGCCGDWVRHLETNGLRVTVRETAQVAAQRARLGMPEALASCHSATVGGYAIEGHVPAREIRRLLAERQRAVGLSVPGMKVGSPGMDGPAYGGRVQPHDVLLVAADGRTSVYASYR